MSTSPASTQSLLAAVTAELLCEDEALLRETRRLRDDEDVSELHLPGCTLGLDAAIPSLQSHRLVSLAEVLTRLVSVAPGCPCIPASDPWGGELARLTPALYDHAQLLDDAATLDNVLAHRAPLRAQLTAVGAARLRAAPRIAGSALWAAAWSSLELVRAEVLAAGGNALSHLLTRTGAPGEELSPERIRHALALHAGSLPDAHEPIVVVGLPGPRLAGLLALTAGEVLAAREGPDHRVRVLLALPASFAAGLQRWEPHAERCDPHLDERLRAEPVLAALTLTCWDATTPLADAARTASDALALPES